MTSLRFTTRVPVFDSNIGVGHRHDRPSPVQNTEGLLEEMHRHGIERALIYHVQGESISGIDGNEALTTWDHESLTFQWVAGATSDSLLQLQEFHSSDKVNTIRLHNTVDCHSPFVDWVYGDLLSWLENENIPLWISLSDTPVVEIMTTLQPFSKLRTVLLGAHYSHSSVIVPILRALPNSYLELSRYENLGAIESLITEFGAGRFLYGSYYPRYAMGPMLYYLHHMAINDHELRAICSQNLEQLLRR